MNTSQEETGTGALINISDTSEQERIPQSMRLVYIPLGILDISYIL